MSCSQRHLSQEGGVPITGALCVLKPVWWHLVKYLNVHGRCLLKVSNAIPVHFILPFYFLANSSLPPLSSFSSCFFYFSSMSKNLFLSSLWLLYPEALLEVLQMQFRVLDPLFSCPYWRYVYTPRWEENKLFIWSLAIVPFRQLKAFRLTIILCFLFLSQWHSDVIPLWGMSKEVQSLLRVHRVF